MGEHIVVKTSFFSPPPHFLCKVRMTSLKADVDPWYCDYSLHISAH